GEWGGPRGFPGGKGERGKVRGHIRKDPPPFLIVHGDADKTVPIRASERLTEALKKAGVEVRFERKAGAGHGGAAFQNDEARKMYEEVFDKHLKKTAPKES